MTNSKTPQIPLLSLSQVNRVGKEGYLHVAVFPYEIIILFN